MVQLIVGKKGKGKTKQLLDKVNSEIKEISGNIVYLDKSTKHMYELNNKVRLIDVSQCMIENSSEFIGFISGIISQDHDLQQMYLDSFLKIACLEGQDIVSTIEKLLFPFINDITETTIAPITISVAIVGIITDKIYLNISSFKNFVLSRYEIIQLTVHFLINQITD